MPGKCAAKITKSRGAFKLATPRLFVGCQYVNNNVYYRKYGMNLVIF